MMFYFEKKFYINCFCIYSLMFEIFMMFLKVCEMMMWIFNGFVKKGMLFVMNWWYFVLNGNYYVYLEDSYSGLVRNKSKNYEIFDKYIVYVVFVFYNIVFVVGFLFLFIFLR